MLCDNCKKEISKDHLFCPYCGKPSQQDSKDKEAKVNVVARQAVDMIKTVYKDPEVREITDDVKNMVVDSLIDTKKRILRNTSKQVKKSTTNFLKTTGLKKKNVFDHVADAIKKKTR